MAIGADESSSRLMQRVESCSQLLRQVLAGKDYIFNGISMSTDDIPRGLSSPDISVYKYIHMYIYIYACGRHSCFCRQTMGPAGRAFGKHRFSILP